MTRRRRQPGDMRTVEQNVLACCYSLIGLSTAALLLLRGISRRIDRAVALGGVQ